MIDILNAFDAVYVINLDSRPDRLDSFVNQLVHAGGVPIDVVHSKVKRFSGIVPPNKNGALGCILSHVNIIMEAKKNGYKNVLVFEDDMMIVGNSSDAKAIPAQLNSKKWDVFYLGYNSHEPLEQVDKNILKIKNCFSTHAIAYNSSVYDFIIESYNSMSIKILDVWLRDVVQNRFNCLGAFPIQCSQIPGHSDIEGKEVNYDFIMERFRENTKHIVGVPSVVQDIKVSICIPTYEMKGLGYSYLDFSLGKIYEQTYKNIEIVVSDQSNDYSVMRACAKWSDRMKIVYSKEPNRGKSSTNVNNAMSLATGQLVKILFQDDFLYTQDSIERVVSYHKQNNGRWYISSCIHTADGHLFYRPHNPSYHNDIHKGVNTIGAPSVVAYVNSKDFVRFDDNLVWLMDCDYYKRMYQTHGSPVIINENLVAIRAWESNYSNLIDQETKNREDEYISRKYGR